MTALPDWVKKYKTKGVEIRGSGDRYYAYEMSSRWNKEKKRADKITGKYLGVVTHHGIVKPRSMGLVRSDYEYGNIALLYGIAEKTIIPVLKEIYPTMWQRIISYAILRNIQPLPMKSIHYQYEKTYLCRMKDESMSPDSVSKMLSSLPEDQINTGKKNDREDSYKLAKLLRLGELPEVHLPSRYSDDLRSLVRYRKSLGESITMLKNRVHAILAFAGIRIDATDIFGKKGMKCILRSVDNLSTAQRFVLSDLMDQITYLMRKESTVEDEISRYVISDRNVKLLMTIPGMGIYSSAAIMSEIDDISRFETKEKLASYAGLTPRQNQSGSSDIRGHITKHGPSMLRFILVNAAHSVIKYSERMKRKYLSLVRRLGKNRAIVAIARILMETIYTMLTKGTEFIHRIDALTERKMAAMRSRAVKPSQIPTIEDRMNELRNVQKERRKRSGTEGKINKSDAIT